MSRTTIDIDDELIRKAMESSGAKTKTEAVEMALRELVRHQRRKELIESLGTYELDIDVDELRRLRRLD
ncbi:MAG TPA: type II toxin-antitoxin system VapB family antitoxin [Chloroflexota bacterium]